MNFLYTLAGLRSPAGEIFFQTVTLLAEELFAVAVICWFYWCANKQLAYTLGFSFFTSGLLIQGMKITFRIPRPWILDPQFQPVASAVPAATGYSFPSGHTQSITALFGTLWISTDKRIFKIFCTLIIVAVAFSRMYLGCHTPKDVVVSLLLSFSCALLTYHFFHHRELSRRNSFFLSAVMLFFSLALSFYAVILLKRDIIELHYAQDCLKSSGTGAAFSLGYYIERTYLHFVIPENSCKKILRFLIGIAAAAFLLLGLKTILGTSLCASFFRYFLTVLWIAVLYPYLFSKIPVPKR